MPDDDLQPGLVSFIAPCYNVERFIGRFFDSLVAQTYKQLEVILVNDGSTDGTGELIRASVPLLEAEGYRVKVVEQENRGLAGAVDAGLKVFTGEFLTWPDPDDWLTPDSIEKRVKLFRDHPEAGLVRTSAAHFIDASAEFDGHSMEPDGNVRVTRELFSEFLFLRTFYHPVCHMARSSMFLECVGREIFFQPKSSQNLQMLLPLAERYPAVVAGVVCGNYTIRSDSRSQRARTAADLIARMMMLRENTLRTIPKLRQNHQRLEVLTHEFYLRNRLGPVAFEGGLAAEAREFLARTTLSWPRRLAAGVLIGLRRSVLPERRSAAEAVREPDLLGRAFRKLTYFDPDRVNLGIPLGRESTSGLGTRECRDTA